MGAAATGNSRNGALMAAEIVLFLVVLTMAAVSTAVGPAGGVVFAAMALVLPGATVVPVHAAVQVGGTGIRLAVLRQLVDRRATAVFALGGLVGVVPAALVASRLSLDSNWLRLGLGIATLVPVFVRPRSGFRDDEPNPRSMVGPVAGLGAVTSFLAVFVGATGAVIGSFLGKRYDDQRRRVATHTSCVFLQHGAKVAVYSAVGFSFRSYLPLIGLLLAASAIGAVVGRRVLDLAPNDVLKVVFDVIIVALGASIAGNAALLLVVGAS